MGRSAREALADAKRIVIKIGSRAITTDPNRIQQLASQVTLAQRASKQVVVVSSGAVAVGRERLGFAERPKETARLQATAAAGQSLLMRAYEDAFESEGVHVAQVLLTHGDLSDRERYLNARRTLDALMGLGVVAVINENDAVSVEELTFGDNDQLAAMVANLIGADLLVILTDVEGLLDETGARVAVVDDIQRARGWIMPSDGDVGLGGMGSKLEAAARAIEHGVPVVIGPAANPALLQEVLRGEDVGTLILPVDTPMASRKHWIAYTLKPRGSIRIDDGAKRALIEQRSSLLPAGVTGVEGVFEQGDAVRILDAAGNEIARGLARYGVGDTRRCAGKQGKEVAAFVEAFVGQEIVHRDDLVVTVDKG